MLRKSLGKVIELPTTYGGQYVLGVVESMGWYLSDGMGAKPIPPTELRAFCKDMGIKLYKEEIVQALAISRAYCAAMAKYRDGGEPPYKSGKDA